MSVISLNSVNSVATVDADATLGFSNANKIIATHPKSTNLHSSVAPASIESVPMSLCDSDERNTLTSNDDCIGANENNINDGIHFEGITTPTITNPTFDSNNTSNDDIPAPVNNTTAKNVTLGSEFVMENISCTNSNPTSLAELLALSPFSAATAAASPADSLDSECEYFKALRDTRKQLAGKLREALRELRNERQVKTGLLRKRYQMRNRRYAAGNGANPNTMPDEMLQGKKQHQQQQHCGGDQQETQQSAYYSDSTTPSFSDSARATESVPAPAAACAAVETTTTTIIPTTATAISKSRPPPKITPGAIEAGISGNAKKALVGKGEEPSVPQERWYGDCAKLCSSPVSEEFEVELGEDDAADANAHHMVGHPANSSTVELVAPECHA